MKGKVVDVWDQADEIVEGLPAQRKHPYKAFVNIMYGCDNLPYCIVPHKGKRAQRIRSHPGRSQSWWPTACWRLPCSVKMLILIGPDRNQDKEEAGGGVMDSSGEYVSFAGLIHMLNEVEGLKRIRFTTSHPKDLRRTHRRFASCENCATFIFPYSRGARGFWRR